MQLQKQDHQSTPKIHPLFLLMCLNVFLLSNQIQSSSVFAPTVCGWLHRESTLRHKYSRIEAINSKRSTPCLGKLCTCATIKGGAKTTSMDAACYVRCAHDSTTSCVRC